MAGQRCFNCGKIIPDSAVVCSDCAKAAQKKEDEDNSKGGKNDKKK